MKMIQLKQAWLCFLLCFLFGKSHAAQSSLNVLTCEPEWAALVKTLSGNWVDVSSATTAQDDPHHIQARPSLIAKARRANLLVCTGAELEIGWLPLLQSESANSAIQNNAAGFFETSSYVTLLEKPTDLSRSQGDVHAAGNPHFQLDPRLLLKVARPLADKLIVLDPSHKMDYEQRYAKFEIAMRQSIEKIEQQVKPLKGKTALVYHSQFFYLLNWFGIKTLGDLEPKPGVDPSLAHLSELKNKLNVEPATWLIYGEGQSQKPVKWILDNSPKPIKTIQLPKTIDSNDNIVEFYERLAKLFL
jgi:zinc/manganese transport system substrate-binding protein